MQAMLWAINHLTLSEEKTICSFSRSRTSWNPTQTAR
jgi:hypothetical protein